MRPVSDYNATATMRANRSRNTKPELELRSEMFRRGLRFNVNRRVSLDGKSFARPDIVFPKLKIAVFVDGCFWHACPLHGQVPRRNREFWSKKLSANQRRDRVQDVALAAAGWQVIRIWEHEAMPTAADRINDAVSVRQEELTHGA